MQAGLIGLGRMGGRIKQRLTEAGHTLVCYDTDPALSEVESIEALVAALTPPRTIWVMVPAGPATDAVFDTLLPRVDAGDLLVDGGNSNVRDTMARAALCHDRGVAFLDAGVSGGVHGGDEGFCIMVGGEPEAYQRVEPLLEAMAQPEGYALVGPGGAGHYAKMCHNAIEYAMMQAYAEGFDLLRAFDAPIDTQRVADLWNHGSIIRSWLLTLTARALERDPDLEGLAPYVDDSGEGRWAVQEAVDRGVSANVIAQALFQRFQSRDDRRYGNRLLAALRHEFGQHEVRSEQS